MPSESENENNGSTVEEYRNVATQVLSKFMQKDKMDTDGDINSDSMAAIDFEAPKISPSTSLETLAAALDYELTEKEWFVTGNVNPSYFSPDFQFQDPDVKVDSIEDYSKGVRKIFNQSTSRAEILSTVVNEEASTPEKSVITITWRLSGGVNIGFGLDIKPYIVYTDFVIDPETSLVIFQEDRFDIPSWDILLSALFPFVIGKITSPAAPSVPARDLTMPKVDFIGSKTPNPSMSFGGIFKSFMGSQ
eukprot:CAMPEP_0201152146 /NCGR_PEP_ID=MMETSP0851-20130426/12902_1 /ASSEMBLY_ACC=CAM_ASM_000631 /TAXON_ID=183588 /ORGANISM="Pseudo-nitzschia fraudulenta, Strain WWA7" /LENGTH=247 /DNA_ID=CAMNT_0047429115 /DNA_START=202 /DNA_END=945 /DNA_ORIENTATION=+